MVLYKRIKIFEKNYPLYQSMKWKLKHKILFAYRHFEIQNRNF